jgi:hypothetical protein
LIALFSLSTISGIAVLGPSGLSATFYQAVSVICLYSVAFITLRRLYSAEEILVLYVKVVKWAVVAAGVQILFWILFKRDSTEWLRTIGLTSRFGGEEGFFVRVTAWWQEPAQFAAFLSLGLLLAALPLPSSLAKKLNLGIGWRGAMVATFALTFSTSAMPVVIFIFLVYSIDRHRKLALIILCVVVVVWVLSSGMIGSRLLALRDLSANQGETNLSVWALSSNLMASYKSLGAAPFGLGVGNHSVAYAEWLKGVSLEGFSRDQFYLNARDAGSMLIRLLTEFGFPSVLIWIYLISRSVRLAVQGRIRFVSSLFIEFIGISAFLTMCLRQGSYSLFDPWFFLLVFIQARTVKQTEVVVSSTVSRSLRRRPGTLPQR